MCWGARFAVITGLLAATVSDFASTTVTFPLCPVPVLISQVDRVGVQGPRPRRSAGAIVGGISTEVRSELIAAGGANGDGARSSETVGPGVLTANVLGNLPTGRGVENGEVRLEEVWVRGYVSYQLFLIATGSTGRPIGTILRYR